MKAILTGWWRNNMGAFELGSFSASTTGNKTVLLSSGGTPTAIEFWVGNRASTNETDIRYSEGCADGTNQTAMAIFAGTNKGTRSSNAKCVMHYIDSAGATLKVQGSLVSFGAGQFIINMDTVDVNYPIFFKAHF